MTEASKSAAKLTDAMLWQCLDEAEERKLDGSLPIEVRIRAAVTFSELLRAAAGRGYDYSTLKAAATGSAA